MNPIEKIFRNFFRIKIFLGAYSYLRFLYFFYIKKSFKTYYPIDSSEHGMAKNSYETALESNVYHTNKPFRNFFKYFAKFKATRSNELVYPLKSLGFVDFQSSKVLSVGPRLESEIYTLFANGFRLKNIKSIDLQSYTSLIDLGDMLKMPYEDNSFDVVVVGWVLAYTDKVQEAIKEFVRVSKNGSLISIGISHKPDIQLSKVPLKSSKEIISYFGDNLNQVYFSHHPNDDTFIKKDNQINSYKSIIVVSVKK